MAVNYQKLWELLKEKCMTRSELREKAGVTTNAMVKLGKNESVQAEVLAKICRALGCTMNDIMDIDYHDEAAEILPEIDFFDEINSSLEYSVLDINKLADFPTPHTKESIKNTLIEYCRSAKLSYDACVELIEVLATKDVHISFPQDITPDINLIPFVDIQNDDCSSTEIITQQINNYIAWAIKNSGFSQQGFMEKISSRTNAENSYIVEDGYVSFEITCDEKGYVGKSLTTKSGRDVYPFNLIYAIFGDIGSLYCLNHRIPMLSEQVDNVLDTLTPCEEFWIRLSFQYGATSETFFELLNIPYNEDLDAVLQNNPVINKALRKLRHPLRSRKLKHYFDINPYKTCYMDWYSSWKDDIKDRVSVSIDNGCSISDALSEFYNESVIAQVEKESTRWKEIPNISIDEMDISWRTYAALEVFQILSLEELWNNHGRNLSLNDLENSGLRNVAGLGTDQVSELLNKMGEYDLLPIGIGNVPDIIDYAERLTIKDGNTPSVACVGIHPNVLTLLLHLKYRNIDDVIADYSNGCLEEKMKKQDSIEWQEVQETIAVFADKKHPVTHYSNRMYWCDLLAKNPQYTLEDIRKAYILDKPLKCNPHELQEHIEDLFPIHSLAFDIMHKTRTRAIRWSRYPISVFAKEAKEYRHLGFDKVDDLRIKGIFKATYDNLHDFQWFVIEDQKDEEKQYYFFEFGHNGFKEITHLSEQERISLFQAIEFNAEILKQMRNGDEYVIISPSSDKDKNHNADESSVSVSEKVLQLSIEQLDLSVRAYNCLKRAEISTVREIAKLKKHEFRSIRNLGKKSLEEIFQKLISLGIPLDYSLQELFDEL